MRSITIHGRPSHVPTLTGIIIQGIMPTTAIVPERNRPLAPSEPASEPLIARMIKQEAEQGFALSFCHARKS